MTKFFKNELADYMHVWMKNIHEHEHECGTMSSVMFYVLSKGIPILTVHVQCSRWYLVGANWNLIFVLPHMSIFIPSLNFIGGCSSLAILVPLVESRFVNQSTASLYVINPLLLLLSASSSLSNTMSYRNWLGSQLIHIDVWICSNDNATLWGC